MSEKDETYYANLDKRTKEYKEWKEKYDSAPEGLGDSIEKITKATGIKKAVEFIAGEDCGCDERREKLNKIFRYEKPNCLSEEDYYWCKDFFKEGKTISRIERDDVISLYNVYNRVFNKKDQPSSCPSCVKRRFTDLHRFFINYEK